MTLFRASTVYLFLLCTTFDILLFSCFSRILKCKQHNTVTHVPVCSLKWELATNHIRSDGTYYLGDMMFLTCVMLLGGEKILG